MERMCVTVVETSEEPRLSSEQPQVHLVYRTHEQVFSLFYTTGPRLFLLQINFVLNLGAVANN